MQKILVVEDDRAVQRVLKRLFEYESYRLEITRDWIKGLEAFRSSPPALVVLDLGVPGIRGNGVCRQIKKEAPSLPVIVLGAKTDLADKVLLLDSGADDYVTQPFSPRELLARVGAAVRCASRGESRFIFGDISVDFAKMELRRAGQLIAMTAMEFKILKFFSENLGRVASREELLYKVWGYSNLPLSRTVDSHIHKLRKKIEDDPENPRHLLAVHGFGYRFVS